jgi:hypothetical protein
MSNQREQRLSTGAGSLRAIPSLLVDLAAITVAITLVILAWNDTAAATGEVPMRIFLVGWAVAIVIVWDGFPFTELVSRREEPVYRSVLPAAVHHVAVGAVIGLAVGTTDWTDLRFAGWWQLWWTVPLLLAYASRLRSLQRLSRRRS